MNSRLVSFFCVVAVCLVSCGKDNPTESGRDAIPPATITDLSVERTGQEFRLRWTAPGDDGPNGRAARYDIRYAAGNLGAGWSAAAAVSSPPTPGNAGQTDSVTVSGIGWGLWEFGVKAVDEAQNWSILSNVVVTVPGDTIAPEAVTDLAVDLLTPTSVVLRWTAPGNDGGVGLASEYDLRYAPTPITPDTWDSATRVTGLTAPRSSGEIERWTVGNLQKGTSYIFALKAADVDGNWSDLSNLVPAWIFNPVQITFAADRSGAYGPDWSPNGQCISFTMVGGKDRYSQIHVVRPSGGSITMYTETALGTNDPSWSPDGSRFALGTGVNPGTAKPIIFELAVMAAQPQAPPQLLKSHLSSGTNSPRWSPDGAYIAYVVSGLSETGGIHIIPATGGEPRRLYGGWYVNGLDWSPDGARIVYSSKQNGTYDLWTMSPQGGEAVQLTDGPGSETSPRWSPDGDWIAYEEDYKAIWTILASGGSPMRVIYDESAVWLPGLTWSPDGRSIAYGRAKSDYKTDIWVQRVR